MKKGILLCLLFLLPIGMALVGMEISLRNIPNSYQIKNDYLNNHADKIQVLILGHSQLLYGLNPEHFSLHTFNAAHVSQLYTHDLAILRKYIEKLRKLEYLILPVTYTSFFDEGTDNAFINKNYVLYYGLQNTLNWGNAFELSAFSLRDNFMRLLNYLIYERLDHGVTALGFGTGCGNYTQLELEKTAKDAAARHHSSMESFLPENSAAYEELLELALSQNIRVLLITPPVHREYYRLIDKANLAKTKHFASATAERELLINYIDLDQHTDFTDLDFYDADHLNEKGAEKLSRLVDEIIKN